MASADSGVDVEKRTAAVDNAEAADSSASLRVDMWFVLDS